jgi:hypothetical protein
MVPTRAVSPFASFWRRRGDTEDARSSLVGSPISVCARHGVLVSRRTGVCLCSSALLRGEAEIVSTGTEELKWDKPVMIPFKRKNACSKNKNPTFSGNSSLKVFKNNVIVSVK